MHSINKILKNGLNLVLVPMPHLHSMYLTMFIRAGSRFENKKNNGLGHLLEHVIIRGPKERIEALGGQLHSEVAKEFSFYQVIVLPKYFKQGVKILNKMLRQPELDSKIIQIEKEIIREEALIYKGKNEVDIDLDELSAQLLWPRTSLALKIQGAREQIKRYNKKDCQQYWQQFYIPNNMLLCLVGNFKTRQCQILIKDLFGDWRSGIPARIKTVQIKQAKPQYYFVQQPGSQIESRIAFHIFSYQHPGLTTLEILDNIVNARVKSHIRTQQGLVYNIKSYLSTFADAGILNIDFSVSPEKLTKVIQVIISLTSQKIVPQELNRAKLLAQADLKFVLDRPEEITDMFGLDELLGCFKPPQEKLKEITEVSIDDVQKFSKQIFILQNLNLIVVGPYKKEQETEAKRLIKKFKKG